MEGKCKFWDNCTIEFDCMVCEGNYRSSEDDIYVCFTHKLVMCDECFNTHREEHFSQDEIDEENEKNEQEKEEKWRKKEEKWRNAEEERRKIKIQQEKEELQKKIAESENLIKDLKERLKRI